MKIIYADFPEGIFLKECDYGYGLFASKEFKAGEVLYQYHYEVIDMVERDYTLRTNQGEFILHTTTHSVAIGKNRRALYTFDSFMNHSCDPSSYSFADSEMASHYEYQQVAARDIHIGDEITCDYMLFDYDCSDKKIESCHCGSLNCRKKINGFKWLPLYEQIKLLKFIDSDMFSWFLVDHPQIIYMDQNDLKIPTNIAIIKNDNAGFKIVSNESYEPGDVLYENKTLYFDKDRSLMVHLNNEFILLDNVSHTVKRGDFIREFYYFDTFMNHSCDPNTITYYHAENGYQTIALKRIHAGQELTCDYSVFDLEPDGDGFVCTCGSENCRGIVY